MKKILLFTWALLNHLPIWAVARFPKPDFTSGYQYPDIQHPVPFEQFWNWVDVVLMVVLMSVVSWAAYKNKSRKAIFIVSIVSVLYFGFYRSGCVCSIGSIQNVVLSLTDSTYQLPWYVLFIFILPIIFTFMFGRVFCAGVCPFGALQELVNVKNFRVNRAVATALGVIPWVYLAFVLLYAATRSQFLICRLDPFIGIFRLCGDTGLITFGVFLLLTSLFVGRPFCQFLCPYGALLSVFGSVSLKKMEPTDKDCINCKLCHHSCPVDALCPPYANVVKEDRLTGVKRLLLYFILLPFLTGSGAWLVGSNSEALSHAHKDVYLYGLIQMQETDPELEPVLEVTAFNEMGRSIEELETQVKTIQREYRIYGYFAGALIGFVIGYKLIRLSLKRTRKTYEIDHAACVACGKCFDYCPQNVKRMVNKNG